MAEFDVQDAIHALRTEIQVDRLATVKAITEGFDRLADKLDDHAVDDSRRFAEIDERLARTETKQNILSGAIGAGGTAFVTWLFGMFKGQ